MSDTTLGALFAVLVLVGPGHVEADLVLGQVDDFSATTMGWTGGSSPTLVLSGGPAGINDGYLQITSRFDGRFGTFNDDARWTGDLGAAQAIGMDVNNLGPVPIDLRIMLVDRAETSGSFASTNAVTLPANSGWMSVQFSLGAANMTHVGGGSGVYADTLASVDALLIHHDSGAPSGPRTSPSIFGATLGIDNISAVPEPSSVFLVGLVGGLALVVGKCCRRCLSR